MTKASQPPTTPAGLILQPLHGFAKNESSGGIVLLVCAVLALALVNSPLSVPFLALWDTNLSLQIGGTGVSKTLRFWINDGLMAMFFFVVGLEIKREILVGELSSPRQVALPLVAAIGGMAVPAALYLAFNPNAPEAAGWGVPMATDIAFALGVLSLFGARVPVALKIFLTALAIFDDIGAVLVIAFFYTDHMALSAIAASGVLLGLAAAANWLGVRSVLAYGTLGVALWIAMLNSGFHASIAGVLLALAIPARSHLQSNTFVSQSQSIIDEFSRVTDPDEAALCNDRQQSLLLCLERASERAGTPLQRLEHVLHPWTAFLVMPIFALANAGVVVDASFAAAAAHPVTLGIVVGLVLGKPLGVIGFAWLAVKLGLADLPEKVGWLELSATGCLAGIGFTMALFIGGLAFNGNALLDAAKIGILAGSLISGIVGASLLWAALRFRNSE